MTRSMMGLGCLAVGLCLVAPGARGQEPTSEPDQKAAVAESVIAREEAASERPFDRSFRAKTLHRLAALPMAALLRAQAREDVGLGLNALGDSQADLVYTPVTPCRIVDTRLAGGALSAGVPRSFKVTGDTTFQGGANCGIPFGPATSAMINFVAVDPAGPGNIRLTPFGQPIPRAAIINYSDTAGTALANGLAVALCNPSGATCTNDVTVRADVSGVDLVADVEGYFQRVSTGGVGTSLLADSAVTTVKMANGAVTTPKIGNGVVVRTLNGQTDAVTLEGSNGLGVTQGSGAVTVSSNATAANTPNTIVARDASGSFTAGTLTLAGNLNLPNTASAMTGAVALGGAPFLHNFGVRNTFAGSQSGNTSMTGTANTGVGFGALHSNTTGWGNASLGEETLYSNTTGYANAAFGDAALRDNTTGNDNSAVGDAALYSNTTGNDNSAVGYSALGSNLTGNNNSAFGSYALALNTTGSSNSGVGFGALNANTTGQMNAAFGASALLQNTVAGANSAFGYDALYSNTTGSSNSAFGWYALVGNTTGSRNVAIGISAGADLASGNDNVYVANRGASTESSTIRIGTVGTHAATYVAGIHGVTSASGSGVYVNSSGQLGTTTSSRRYKQQIVEMDSESDVLMKLRPVSFYYRPELDETRLRQYGLVAEEVAEVAPGLVEYDADGRPQTVRYHFVNAMLLNEVQKQRRLIEAQEAEIRELRAQRVAIDELKKKLGELEARPPR